VLPRSSFQKIANISDDSYTLGEGIRFSRVNIQMQFAKPIHQYQYTGQVELLKAIAELKTAHENFENAKTPEEKEKARVVALAALTQMENIARQLPQDGGGRRRRKTRGRKGRRRTRR
jgi:hypothetical protein